MVAPAYGYLKSVRSWRAYPEFATNSLRKINNVNLSPGNI